jgi:hypothetical protein
MPTAWRAAVIPVKACAQSVIPLDGATIERPVQGGERVLIIEGVDARGLRHCETTGLGVLLRHRGLSCRNR